LKTIHGCAVVFSPAARGRARLGYFLRPKLGIRGELMMKKIKRNEMWNEKFISEEEYERLRNLLSDIYFRGVAKGFNNCFQEIQDLTIEEFKKSYIDEGKTFDSQ
jgi:hypothetical protein